MNEANQGSSAPNWLNSVLKTGLQAWSIYRRTVRGKIALALVVGGVAIISGNRAEPVVSAVWEVVFGKPITFPEISPLYGIALVVLGIGFYAWTARAERNSAATVVRPTIAVIRHESMEAVTKPLQATTLSAESDNADMRQIVIDQSSLYQDGILSAPAAVRMQMDLVPGIRRLLADTPDAEIVYYGKAHIPLVFLAGHNLSTGWPVHLYELDRRRGNWWAIEDAAEGDDLRLRLELSGENNDSRDAVIRVSISYPVHGSDVAEALPRPYRDVHISIPEPHIDVVRTRYQINAVAEVFRKVLDDFKAEEPGPAAIHVFYSGPMSVAFCLGRQISPTIHPPVFVYNFTAKTSPKYAWSLHLNGQGTPESRIAYTQLQTA